MGVMIPNSSLYIPSVVSEIDTSKSINSGWSGISILRQAGDAYFYANVVIHDAVIGSRYWLVDNDDYSVVLASGLISSDLETITNVPSYKSPMILYLRLRNASSEPKYLQYEAISPHSKTGVDFYCRQKIQ